MTTNILIVGNGFDLSHYLPTKYEHFLVVMGAIEKWSKDEKMGFNDLFDVNHKKEGSFFQKTKDFYNTDSITLTKEQVHGLKDQLESNSWYKYFKQHIEDIDTWIDFENQIQKLLECFTSYLLWLKNKNSTNDLSDKLKIMENLSFFQLGEIQVSRRELSKGIDRGTRPKETKQWIFNTKFYYRENIQNGFNSSSFLSFLQIKLEEFIEVFNLYLKLIIDKLEPKRQFKIVEKKLATTK